MTEEFLTAGRTTTLRRLLYVVLGAAVVIGLLGVGVVLADPQRYAVTLLVIAAVYAVLGGLSLRAVARRDDSARRLCIATAVVVIVLSLPLAGILIGLLTAVLGVGLLVIVFAPEREQA